MPQVVTSVLQARTNGVDYRIQLNSRYIPRGETNARDILLPIDTSALDSTPSALVLIYKRIIPNALQDIKSGIVSTC